MPTRLRLTEIFYSLQGETNRVGLPTVFIRLTGCPLRCQYCDTAYAFSGGEWWDFNDILAKVKSYGTPYVTVTGGEPLAQPACIDLLDRLVEDGYKVSLETSGAMDISKVNQGVMTILDIKTPGSKEESRNLWSNLAFLKPGDQIKFVICDREDYEWAKQIVIDKKLNDYSELLFSPSYQELSPTELANWIIDDKLQVRFQIQLHKLLWGDKPGV